MARVESRTPAGAVPGASLAPSEVRFFLDLFSKLFLNVFMEILQIKRACVKPGFQEQLGAIFRLRMFPLKK